MNILIYNRHFFPSVGGTEISGRIMARELVRLGNAVAVVTATPLLDNSVELEEGYQIVRSEGIPTLVRQARANDVLLIRGGISLRAFLAAWCGDVPVVAFHELDPTAGRAGGGVRRRATDAIKAMLRRRARLHVVVSDALRASINLPAGADWFRLYNPVAEELWTPSPPNFVERDFDVLFVGRLVPDKGLIVLKNALRALPPCERLRVAIAGSSENQTAWEDQFREVASEVTFVGCISGEGLRDLYARARIVVVPSLVNEGMGMVAAEALANGTPVCASDQPALREVIGDAGLFHPIGDAVQLAADIERLLSDPEYWQVLSTSARCARSRFSMRQYRENLSALVMKIEYGH